MRRLHRAIDFAASLIGRSQFDLTNAGSDIEPDLAFNAQGLQRNRPLETADEHIGAETDANGGIRGGADIGSPDAHWVASSLLCIGRARYRIVRFDYPSQHITQDFSLRVRQRGHEAVLG